MPKFKLSPEFVEAYINNPLGAPNPDVDFLDQFGLTDAVIMSRWIREVGVQRFAEIVFAFAQPRTRGRPKKSDYTRFLNEFNRLKALQPTSPSKNLSSRDYEIAHLVAAEAFQKNDWRGFRPPATEKAMADVIVRQVKAAKARDSAAGGDRAKTIQDRIERRAQAFNDRAWRFVALAEELKREETRLMFAALFQAVADKEQVEAEASAKTDRLIRTKKG